MHTTTLPQNLTFQEEMSRLKKEIKRRGYYRKQPGRMLAERFVFLSIQLVGMWAYWYTDYPTVKYLAIVLTTIAVLGGATYTHTASHQGIFRSRWVNNLVVYLGYPFQIGLSATYWWHKHVVVHHPNPNIYGIDDDIDLMPYFALTEADLSKASTWQRYWFRWQWLIFPLSLSLNFVNMQVNGWKHLVGNLTDRSIRKLAHWLDLLCLLFHYAVFICLPTFFVPFSDVIIFYVSWLVLTGFGAFAVLAPGHYPAEATVFTEQAKQADVYRQQLATTVNIRVGWLGRWLLCGLDYQIEHHLFPGVSHQFYPAISALLKPICHRHGYPHQTLGWGEALWKSYQIIRKPKPVVDAVIPTPSINVAEPGDQLPAYAR